MSFVRLRSDLDIYRTLPTDSDQIATPERQLRSRALDPRQGATDAGWPVDTRHHDHPLENHTVAIAVDEPQPITDLLLASWPAITSSHLLIITLGRGPVNDFPQGTDLMEAPGLVQSGPDDLSGAPHTCLRRHLVL
jgi:hypothetical protein